MNFKSLPIFCFLALGVLCERKRFDGCEVWKVKPKTNVDLSLLLELYKNSQSTEGLYFPDEPRLADTELLVCPPARRELSMLCHSGELTCTLVNNHFQRDLDELWRRYTKRHQNALYAYDPNDYNSFEDVIAIFLLCPGADPRGGHREILQQLRVFQSNCPPGFQCSIETIGRTYEDRPIEMLSITRENGVRRGVFMDSLIHAREWIAGATNLNILSKLITDYGVDADATRLLDTYDWYFAPVLNPDGYVYTWTDNVMWRKNRTPNEGSLCFGTDLNRNFGYNWGLPGASDIECSETYRGSGAASELETQATQEVGQRLSDSLFLWITWHSTAYMWLLPYGQETVPGSGTCYRDDDFEDMQRAANACVRAIINTYNDTQWIAGPVCEVLYPSSGSTLDWAKGANIVKYSLNPELRGPGFQPSADNIQPSFTESWNGLLALVREIELIEGWST